MIIFWLNACFLWFLGIIFTIHTIKNWNSEGKKQHRASESVEILLFFIMGYYLLRLFSYQNELTNLLMWSLFLFNFFILLFFLGNVVPNYLKKRSNPNFRKRVSYQRFIEKLQIESSQHDKNKSKERITDYSRKILHLLQFAGLIIVHYLAFSYAPVLNDMGITPIELRNYIYFYVACFFWIMMLIGDLTRMECFKCLPKWAFIWYKSSLNVEREQWTVNAVIPILLANLFWINPLFPTYVFFMAVFVSCISDAVASFVGKEFGKRRWNKLAYFQKKTQEGTLTAAFITIIGCLAIVLLVPSISLPLWYIIVVPIGNAIIFIIIDMYGHFLSDNLLNSMITGAFSWIMSCLLL